MRSDRAGLWIGLLLIVVGVVILIRNLVPWWIADDLMWALAFAILAAAVFATHHRYPRLLLPLLGWGLAGLTAVFALRAAGSPYDDVTGAAFLLALAIGFLTLHPRQPGHWWAFLVGGTLFVLAALTAVAELDLLTGEQRGFVFFFGLALVFLYLYAIRTPENRLSWAGYPSLACFLVAVFILVTQIVPDLQRYFWPAALIIIGGWLVLKDVTRKRSTPARQAESQGGGAAEPEADEQTGQ